MGLPPEPSKTCSFRKCNIPLFTIVWKKIFKVQQMPKNKGNNQWKHAHLFSLIISYEYTENMKRDCRLST